VIVAAVSLAIGGHFPNGVGGVAVLIVIAALLGASFASLSNALALVVRQRESLIGAVTSVTLPLTFLSTAFMQQTLVPGWIRWVARFNPVNWAVEAGRSAATEHTDWNLVLSRGGLLLLLLLVSAWLATRSFRAYQRSI
jgi:ABC-2 type transport system permease protein